MGSRINKKNPIRKTNKKLNLIEVDTPPVGYEIHNLSIILGIGEERQSILTILKHSQFPVYKYMNTYYVDLETAKKLMLTYIPPEYTKLKVVYLTKYWKKEEE